MAKVISENGKYVVIDSSHNKYDLNDKRVHVLLPSMGDASTKAVASAMRYIGINATAVEPPAERELKLGRANSTCKECLPLMLTVGSMLDYLENRSNKEEILVYFMPSASGPCRFGQYTTLIKNLVRKNRIKDVAVLSLTDDKGYGGLGLKFMLRAWQSLLIGDILDEIYSSVLVLSKDREHGMRVFKNVSEKIMDAIEKYSWKRLQNILIQAAKELSEIPLNGSLHKAKKIALVGEIYVRRDGFSRQYLVKKMADHEIIVKVAPIAEWIYYTDYRIKTRLEPKATLKSVMKTSVEGVVKTQYERIIKRIMAHSGLYEYKMVNIDEIIDNIKHVVSPKLSGEAILTVGSALTEIIDEVSGVISIGPFGCMPNRMSEAIIGEVLNKEKIAASKDKEITKKVLDEFPSLPFLAIESDGNVFPQVIQARLETFCLQVHRMNDYINSLKNV